MQKKTDLKIESTYLCQFDTTIGNTLLKLKSKEENNKFLDLEYLSLPAGLHDLPTSSDTVKFEILNSKGDTFLSICRVYNNTKSIINPSNTSVDRSKVKIYSFGVIIGLNDSNDAESLLLFEDSIVKQIDSCFKLFIEQADSELFTTKLFENLTNNTLLSDSSVWKEPTRLLKAIDCLILPLWKQLMLKKKILIINNETSRISFDEMNKLVEYLKNISSDTSYNCIYNTVLSNFEIMLTDESTHYIAYTTDTILKDVSTSYDVLLELKKNGEITVTDRQGKPLHATFVDGLKLITKFKNDTNKFDGKSGSQKFIDFFYILFTFNTIKPAYYRFIDSSVGIPLEAPLEKERFANWLVSVNTGLESLLANSKNYDIKTKTLTLKPSDVLLLGFDGFNQNDLEFLKSYVKLGNFSKDVKKLEFKNFDFSLFI
ncbi:hypothetical protein QEN19_002665 [Hanseniaspora menglaensis]